MFSIFIKRPVLSTVISIMIVILGILGMISLPIEQYPDIAPPTVRVTATFTGANAETVLKSVVAPLEEAINGVEGMTYMISNAANDGSITIYVFFDLGMNPDIATVNVQNRVARTLNLLPPIVVQTGVVVVKSQNSALFFTGLYSSNPAYDEIFLQNYAKINILPRLQRIKGVGDATAFGQQDYSMRIWLNPSKMQMYKLMPSDVQAALLEQNIEAAPGKFGENSASKTEFSIKYKGRLFKESEYENIIVKSLGAGKYVRLGDVAEVSLGGFSYNFSNKAMGYPAAVFGLFQVTGSNANQITIEAEKILAEEKKSFPQGVDYIIPYNSKDFLDASIEEVVRTLVEAFLLAFLVVFIFLQNLRATLIPIISVPVSIIGTFFFLKIFGYTINMLTLFAMVLSIGIVVDDAIVVVEAVHTKLEEGYKSAKDASLHAMREIYGAIISITLVLVSVFVPVMFIAGASGRFYQQFAVTLAVSIVISAINALTLSPALCAIFLKPHEKEEHGKKKNILERFFAAFNQAFEAIIKKYTRAIRFLSQRKAIPIAALVLAAIVVVYLFKTTSTGFIPNEDRGNIFVDVTLAPGSSLSETKKVVTKVDSIMRSMPVITQGLDMVGNSILLGVSGPAYGFIAVKLKHWNERTDPKDQIDAIIKELYQKTANIKNARLTFFSPPTVRGFGNADGFEFKLYNKGDDDWAKMEKTAVDLVDKLRKRPEFAYVTFIFNSNFPQYEAVINLEKVKDAGLRLNDILTTMQGYYGGLYTTDFNRFGKQYRVMIEAKPEDRMDPSTLNNIYVTNREQRSVSIREFVDIKRIFSPEIVSRYNLFKSVHVTGKANPGYSSGDAIRAIQEITAENLPSTYSYEFTGIAREEIIAGNQSIGIFILSLIFVYFILSALYESYIVPFSVIFSLVIGVMGALLFIKIAGLQNNVYFQIALIMLLGLLAKNAILIVEFALIKRREGMKLYEAAIEGGRLRLRPILMTSFAFILGISPLAFSGGIGSIGNRSIGMGAMGGLLVGTICGVFVIPALFIIFQGLQEKFFGEKLAQIENKKISD